MSIKCMNYVWTQSETSGVDRLMLLALADSCNDDGEWSPGVTRLADKCNMDKRWAQRVLHRLEEIGEIEIAKNKGVKTSHGYTNHYRMKRFQELDGVVNTPPRAADGVVNTPPQGVVNTPPNTSVYPTELNTCTHQKVTKAGTLTNSAMSSVEGKPLTPPIAQPPPSPKRKPTSDPQAQAAWEMYLAKIDQYEGSTAINFGRERKAINQLVKLGWTAEQIGACFDLMKADDFWASKHLSAQSLGAQIGAKLNGKGKPSNGSERIDRDLFFSNFQTGDPYA